MGANDTSIRNKPRGKEKSGEKRERRMRLGAMKKLNQVSKAVGRPSRETGSQVAKGLPIMGGHHRYAAWVMRLKSEIAFTGLA